MTDLELKLLKPLVNNADMWKILDSHMLKCYNNKHKELENVNSIELMYKAQGYIQAIKMIRDLKANVNAKKT